MNCSPTLLFSLFTLSIMRITTFDPVGIVHAVLAALDDVGRVTRSLLGSSRGSAVFGRVAAELVELPEDADVAVVEDEDDAVLSSPN